MSNVLVEQSNELLKDSQMFLVEQRTKLERKEKLLQQFEEIEKELEIKGQRLEDMLRAATLLGNVADENTKKMLDRITYVINASLASMFKEDSRTIYINQVMWKNQYPHFEVELETANGIRRTFKQSGTGLAQVVSFLFTVCLIDVRNARKLLVMDEILNGLHPETKEVIKILMKMFTESSGFQFVVVEYGMDIGKQYQVVKTNSIANVSHYERETYYQDMGSDLDDEEEINNAM